MGARPVEPTPAYNPGACKFIARMKATPEAALEGLSPVQVRELELALHRTAVFIVQPARSFQHLPNSALFYTSLDFRYFEHLLNSLNHEAYEALGGESVFWAGSEKTRNNGWQTGSHLVEGQHRRTLGEAGERLRQIERAVSREPIEVAQMPKFTVTTPSPIRADEVDFARLTAIYAHLARQIGEAPESHGLKSSAVAWLRERLRDTE
jgi:hypothetical protein